MDPRTRQNVRILSRFTMGLIVPLLLIVPTLLAGHVRAQNSNTPTTTPGLLLLIPPKYTLIAPPLLITKSVPTFVISNVKVLNLKSITLANGFTNTTGNIDYSDQFKGSINVQCPTSMQVGESNVITLQVVPETLAQASMVRADLYAIALDSVGDGQRDKTVVVNKTVMWNWVIAPKAQYTGRQEFFLTLSYENNQGSWVYWQNISLSMTISIPAGPTNTPTSLPTLTFTPTITLIPPSPTITPTLTPTLTPGQKIAEAIIANPVPVIGVAVTLLLGLLSIYFQYVRKKK